MIRRDTHKFFGNAERSLQLTLGAVSRESTVVRGGCAPDGAGFVEGLRMLRQKTCPACNRSRRLEFHSATYDYLCPSCGHDEKAVGAISSVKKDMAAKTDTALPILIAILMTVVFAAFVFYVTFSHSPR